MNAELQEEGNWSIKRLGLRVSTDNLTIALTGDPLHPLSVLLHEEELPKTMTIKLQGGSLRRFGDNKVRVRLHLYLLKVCFFFTFPTAFSGASLC